MFFPAGDSPRERYHNDPQFRALVDYMVASIHQCDFTPIEMRQAAVLASIIYAEHNVHRHRIVLDEEQQAALQVMDKWIDTKEPRK